MAAPPPSPDLTLTGTLLALATVYVSPELAPYVAAYAAILMGWFAGLMVGIARRPPDGRRLPIAWYAAVSLVVVVGVSVPAAQALQSLLGRRLGNYHAMLMPVAFIIPAVGHNWLAFGERLGSIIARRVSAMVRAGFGKGGDQ